MHGSLFPETLCITGFSLHHQPLRSVISLDDNYEIFAEDFRIGVKEAAEELHSLMETLYPEL